jgi:aminoglycoside phosphotransferase (APT) family kinase protein
VAVVEIITSHHERAVVRAGDVYLKVETDPARARGEVAALQGAPVPTPELLWWRSGTPSVLALSAVDGRPLGTLGASASAAAPPAAWTAAGALARRVHDASPPAGLRSWFALEGLASWIDSMRDWLLQETCIAPGLVSARAAFAHEHLDHRAVELVFTHGDLQAEHVLVGDHGTIAGVIDWGDAGLGDPLYDLAVLTVGHGEHLDDVLVGYGEDVDRDVISAYWTLRRLGAVRWMTEHGYDPGGDIAALDIG